MARRNTYYVLDTFEDESEWIENDPGGVADPSNQTDVDFVDVQHVVWISKIQDKELTQCECNEKLGLTVIT